MRVSQKPATKPIRAADRHSRSLAEASILSTIQIMDPILPEAVIKVLNKTRVSFVLAGAYALAGWTRAPRATKDVDVIVVASHVKKAVQALKAAFPPLEPDDQEVVIRFRDPETQEVAIDVMKANQPLFRAAIKHTTTAIIGGEKCKIPTLEMALAMKFAPMISLVRADEKKHLDAHDFISMVKVNKDIDLVKLSFLGELVYPGGGQEVVEMVETIRAGRKLVL